MKVTLFYLFLISGSLFIYAAAGAQSGTNDTDPPALPENARVLGIDGI
ncbi:MAG: hypothetical protein MUD12_07250 [Spirochaetes bacterium]|jgi:hypothetical protein|nr:hypothetical protein [Spirochaetota bacterium]